MIDYKFDKEAGEAIVTIDKKYIGKARCHPDDNDMMSEKVGLTLATYRAQIKLYKEKRAKEKEWLKAFEHLYHCMKQSNQFNEDSYEGRTLKRQIKVRLELIETYTDLIADYNETIRDMIEKKESFYQRVRANRANSIKEQT